VKRGHTRHAPPEGIGRSWGCTVAGAIPVAEVADNPTIQERPFRAGRAIHAFFSAQTSR